MYNRRFYRRAATGRTEVGRNNQSSPLEPFAN